MRYIYCICVLQSTMPIRLRAAVLQFWAVAALVVVHSMLTLQNIRLFRPRLASQPMARCETALS
jgi:hypothetical protein